MEIRLRLPDTMAGIRYCLRNPKSFIIGRYGFSQFIRQRDIMLSAIGRANNAEKKLVAANEKLRAVSIELSKLKRSNQIARANEGNAAETVATQ